MPRYIDADKAIAEINKGDLLVGNNAEWAKEILNRIPTADVVEVRHGCWKDNNNGTFTCSECGGRASKMDWCGCCGAKMDGKGEKNEGMRLV